MIQHVAVLEGSWVWLIEIPKAMRTVYTHMCWLAVS